MLHACGALTHPAAPSVPAGASSEASLWGSWCSFTAEILPGAFPVASPSRMEFPSTPASPHSCLQAPAPSQVCPSVAVPCCPQGVAPRIRAGFILLCIEGLSPAPFPASLVPTLSSPSIFPSTQGGEAAPAGPVGKGTPSVFVQETENVAASSV